MKRTACLILALLLALSALTACGADYSNDVRIGEYVALSPDGETVEYRLKLKTNGEGTITHYPAFGPETTEDIIFTVEESDTLVLHGTEAVGGVVGRNEYFGRFVAEGKGYTVELRMVSTGGVLGLFTMEAK